MEREERRENETEREEESENERQRERLSYFERGENVDTYSL